MSKNTVAITSLTLYHPTPPIRNDSCIIIFSEFYFHARMHRNFIISPIYILHSLYIIPHDLAIHKIKTYPSTSALQPEKSKGIHICEIVNTTEYGQGRFLPLTIGYRGASNSGVTHEVCVSRIYPRVTQDSQTHDKYKHKTLCYGFIRMADKKRQEPTQKLIESTVTSLTQL